MLLCFHEVRPRSSPTKFTHEVHPRSSHIRACWRDVHDAIMVINHGKRVLGLKSEYRTGHRTGSLSGSTLDSLNSSAQLSFVKKTRSCFLVQGVLRPSQKKTGATNLNPTTRLLAETALHQAAAVCMRVHDMRDDYSCLGIPGMLTNIDVQHA